MRTWRDPSQPAQCRFCGATIRFVTMTGTGKIMPVDPHQDPAGNVAIWNAGGRWSGTVITAENQARVTADPRVRRVTAHWATCPDQQPKPSSKPAAEPTLF